METLNVEICADMVKDCIMEKQDREDEDIHWQCAGMVTRQMSKGMACPEQTNRFRTDEDRNSMGKGKAGFTKEISNERVFVWQQ